MDDNKKFGSVIPKWFKKLNFSTLVISVIVFIVLAIGVLGMPQPDAHFFNEDPSLSGGIAKIDVGLFDKFFFQWHRPHIEINIGEINTQTGITFFDVSSMKNGLNLNPYPIFLTILSSLTLTLCGANIFFNFKYQRKQIFNLIINIVIPALILIILMLGLLFYYGNLLSQFMVLTVDVRKLDSDIHKFAEWKANHEGQGFDNSLITDFNLKSVVISYSTLGIASVSAICIISGAVCVLATLDGINIYKNKKVNDKQINLIS